MKVLVPEPAAGNRLDRFLAGLEDIGSRAAAERLVEAGGVRVDGEIRPKSHRLAGGETVEFEPPAGPGELEPENVELEIRYEDEHLLVVDKPAGIVVHPTPGVRRGTLVQGLLGHAVAGGEVADRPGIVHRLDRDTSGLLVVARSPEAHRRLEQLVRARGLERGYLALVRGRPSSRRGRIEAAIGRDRSDPTRHSLDTDTPRDAVTHFEAVELLTHHTLLALRLETGRTHQIRVHLAAIDLPIAGDPVYGVANDLGLARQFLHAARLAFAHPFTEEPLEVVSDLPTDLAAALERARAA